METLIDNSELQQAIEKVVRQQLQESMQLVTPQQAANLNFKMGKPSPEQLAKINSYLDYESTADEWFVCCFRASDNFVNRSHRKWHMNVLRQMEKDFLGEVLMLDHDWYSSESAIGFLFDSRMLTTSDADEDIINSPGREQYNRQILQEEGYCSVYLMGAIHSEMISIIEGIKTRRLNDVSTGGLLSGIRFICPNCSREYGRDVSFNERDGKSYVCPHLMPSQWSKLFFEDEDDEDYQLADYVVLDGTHDSVELSIVQSGNLPAAMVMR